MLEWQTRIQGSSPSFDCLCHSWLCYLIQKLSLGGTSRGRAWNSFSHGPHKYTAIHRSIPSEKNLKTSWTPAASEEWKGPHQMDGGSREMLSPKTPPLSWWHTYKGASWDWRFPQRDEGLMPHIRHTSSLDLLWRDEPLNVRLRKPMGLISKGPKLISETKTLLFKVSCVISFALRCGEIIAVWKVPGLYVMESHLRI